MVWPVGNARDTGETPVNHKVRLCRPENMSFGPRQHKWLARMRQEGPDTEMSMPTTFRQLDLISVHEGKDEECVAGR